MVFHKMITPTDGELRITMTTRRLLLTKVVLEQENTAAKLLVKFKYASKFKSASWLPLEFLDSERHRTGDLRVAVEPGVTVFFKCCAEPYFGAQRMQGSISLGGHVRLHLFGNLEDKDACEPVPKRARTSSPKASSSVAMSAAQLSELEDLVSDAPSCSTCCNERGATQQHLNLEREPIHEHFSDEGRCYMLDTQLRIEGGDLVAASDLSIGSNVVDHQGNVVAVTWCRKLPKRTRQLVDLHTKPLTVTASHRVVVPDGEVVDARSLQKNDEVLIGSERQRLLKVTKRLQSVEVMELEFAGDAVIEVHAPAILTKGSDPAVPIDQDRGLKWEEEQVDDAMDMEALEHGIISGGMDERVESAEPPAQREVWPDTDDDWR